MLSLIIHYNISKKTQYDTFSFIALRNRITAIPKNNNADFVEWFSVDMKFKIGFFKCQTIRLHHSL
jgi:hypothetical protein